MWDLVKTNWIARNTKLLATNVLAACEGSVGDYFFIALMPVTKL